MKLFRIRGAPLLERVVMEQEPNPCRVAVVGAGLSGLTCARALHAAGHRVSVFDKGRGPGGRMSTRLDRTNPDAPGFDHGAPFFEAHDAGFLDQLEAWRQAGVCAPWEMQTGIWARGELVRDQRVCWVGTPQMSAMCEHLAAGLEIIQSCRVESIDRDEHCWTLRVEEPDRRGESGPYDLLVLAAAAGQSARLLRHVGTPIRSRVEEIGGEPVWAAMMHAPEATDALCDLLVCEDDPVLSHVVRNERKPGRTQEASGAWITVHATPSWSRPRKHEEPSVVACELESETRRAVSDALGLQLGRCARISAHRWGLGLTSTAIHERALVDDSIGLVVCGDGFGGAGVEASYLSGLEGARAAASLHGVSA